MGKKKMTNTPRRKRFNQQTRLQNAKNWVSIYKGKNIVRGYSKWFGVDLICAMKELEMLGHKIDEQEKQQIQLSLEALQKNRKRQIEKKRKEQDVDWPRGDEPFFIADYTSNGFPSGITLDELDRIERLKEVADQSKQQTITFLEHNHILF